MSEPGREVAVEWRGTTVRAWLPDPIRGREPALSEGTIRATERAAAAARALASRIPGGFEPLARLLLRAEGLASSRVEGVEAPVTEIVLAEAGAGGGDAAHVADNLLALDDALTHAGSDTALTREHLHAWHRRLMGHGELPDEMVGRWRDGLGWIGGASPLGAVFVAAPPGEIPRLVDDVVEVANKCPWDPVTTAAMVHAQFETVHPYGDGNGRVGRALALWVLARHLEGATVPPPMSVLIARDTDAYVSELGAFRIGMDDHLVRWLADLLTAAGRASIAWAGRLDATVARWEYVTASLRADAAARRMLPLLARHPVVCAERVATELGVSTAAARNGLVTLVEAGILEDLGTVAEGPGRPRRWWSAPELLELVTRWEP